MRPGGGTGRAAERDHPCLSAFIRGEFRTFAHPRAGTITRAGKRTQSGPALPAQHARARRNRLPLLLPRRPIAPYPSPMPTTRLRRLLPAAAVLLVLGAGAFAALAWKPALPPIAPPERASFAPADLARGATLAALGDCAVCHTTENGPPLAGGRGVPTPFGTVHAANITPDPDTGIGRWSPEAFRRAMRDGIDDEGGHLYPVLPYPHFTRATDGDLAALYAFLMTRRPVRRETPANHLPFPFNWRPLLAGWNLLFLRPGPWQPDPSHDAEWNRGAYLVEAMGHCGECHTPRNLLQALNHREKFAGAVQSGWRAYNITSDAKSGIGAWSEAELAQYLSGGHADGRGTAAGPMGEAVDNSLHYLTQGDIAAIVAYLRSVPRISSSDLGEPKATPAPASHNEGVAANVDARGKAIYAGACAGCHDWTGRSPVLDSATLTGVRSVNDPTATNVVQVILRGAQRSDSDAGTSMPAFGHAYSDEEIASLANYVTARFGAQPSAVTAQSIAKLRAQN